MATPAFLIRLMHHVPLAHSVKLGPEDVEAYAFANALRAAALEGRLRCVWTHPANELAGVIHKRPGGKFKIPVGTAIARALGLISGTSDYLFLAPGQSLALEFKSEKGALRPIQRDFRDWCQHVGVPYKVVRSCAAGLALLAELGMLVERQA